MNNLHSLFAFFFILLFSLSFVSSNFVCGFVNNSKDFSSSWKEVNVYFEENLSDITKCKVNPENKFCCDLENISSVEFAKGKKVFAEIFDEENGLIAGPVNLYLTDAGYDVFPNMELKKAIVINYQDGNIFVNKSSISINLSLSKGYNTLRYTINSSEGYLEDEVCEEGKDCSNLELSIPLFNGKNELIFFSNEGREISEKMVLYNLDYFNFNIDFSCDKCKQKKKFFYVPSGEEILIKSSFNSSHNISGDLLFYVPSQWVLSDLSKYEDFSVSHNVLREEIDNKKEFSKEYVFKSPKSFVKQNYILYQKLNEYTSLTKVRTFKFKFIPFLHSNKLKTSFFDDSLEQRASPSEPAIIYPEESTIKLVAIFPKDEILSSHSNIAFNMNKQGKNKEYSFRVLTTIPQRDIEKILLIFEVEKGKSIEVYNNNHKINLELYEENANFTYYSAYVLEKGPFSVKIF